jgi:(p)ppGpp synthase/HD superfamily hydrolase
VTGRQRLPDLVARSPKARAAIAYGEQQHAGQRRSFGRAPFIEHPLEVGLLLDGAGARDDVIAAGLLHDTIEKGSADAFELRARFGDPVAKLVLAVSEDPAIPRYRERKAALRRQVAAAGVDAQMIFAADKVSKVRELRLAVARSSRRGGTPDPSLLRPRRLIHYRRCLGMLEERLGRSPLVEQLRVEWIRLQAGLAISASEARAA